MEFILILLILVMLFIGLRFVKDILQSLVEPTFNRDEYNKNLIETINKYEPSNEEPSRAERIKEASLQLKSKHDIHQAIEDELGIKM